MPIVYIHGVAVRERDISEDVRTLLQRYVAPVISDDPLNVPLHYVHWVGADFKWMGASRPRSPLLGHGPAADESVGVRATAVADHGDLRGNASAAITAGGLTSGQTTSDERATRLADLTPEELSNIAAALLVQQDQDASALIAADEVAHDPDTQRLLAAADTDEDGAILSDLVVSRYNALVMAAGMVGQGTPPWLGRLGDRVGEAVGRAERSPGFVLSRAIGEFRAPINDFVTNFLGDVFVYIRQENGPKPGAIAQLLLDALLKAHNEQMDRSAEPLILLSHSMGGQIAYDVITHYLPAGVRVDFWAAAASQIGLFEELKLFHASKPDIGLGKKVAAPPAEKLGYWWNVWDYNDFLSYTTQDIFSGADDQAYNSGSSLISAHGAYLQTPSFYRLFADHLRAAKAANWRRL